MQLPSSGHTLTFTNGECISFGGLSIDAAPHGRPVSAAPRHARRPASPSRSGPQPTAAVHGYSSGRWRTRTLERGVEPPARSGHAACAFGQSSLLVFGGTDARHKKLADVWQLDLAVEESKTCAWFELTLDAWTAERYEQERAAAAGAEAAAAEAAAAEAAAAAVAATSKGAKGKGSGKGGSGNTDMAAAPIKLKEVLDLDLVARSVSDSIGGLPVDCFDVSVASATAASAEAGDDGVDGILITIKIRPLVGVGLSSVGVDGEALPAALVAKLEPVFQTICPLEAIEGGAEEAKGGKGGGKNAKGGKDADAEEAAVRAAAQRAAAQKRVCGYPLLSWRVERQTRLATVPSVRWTELTVRDVREQAMADAEMDAATGGKGGKGGAAAEITLPDGHPLAPAGRSGHSLSRVRDGVVVFGGSGGRALLGDLWLLKVTKGNGADGTSNETLFGWCAPATSGSAPSPRAFHSSVVRGATAEDGIEQLLVWGGSDGKIRLAELHVLSLPAFHWSSPRVDGFPPPGRCWHTAAGLPATSSFRMIVYGGTDANGRPLRDCHMLTPLLPASAPEGADAAGSKGGGKDKGKAGKADPEPASEGEDLRPVEFRWSGLAASPPPPVPSPLPTTAVSRPQSASPLLHSMTGVQNAAVGSPFAVVKRLAAPAGPTAVATADNDVLIFGGGTDGEPLSLLHLYRSVDLLGVRDEAVVKAVEAPPALEMRSIEVTDLRSPMSFAALSADCELLIMRSDTGEILGRATLLPVAPNAPGAPAASVRLTCSQAIVPLPDDDAYPGDSALRMELHVGSHVGSTLLGASLDNQYEGVVTGAVLVAPPSPQPCSRISFDFRRVGVAPPSRVPPPPAPTEISHASARAALDARKPGSGGMADEYTGEFSNSVPHGVGTCEYASGAVYKGQWKAGKRHGQGEYRDEWGSVYKGGFENDEFAGTGAWHYADGSTYSGPMVGGHRHGKGIFRGSDGSVYEGEWFADERTGFGVERDGEGLTSYRGGWLHDKRHGSGKIIVRESLKSSRTSVYDGEWQHGCRHGQGRCVYPNGEEYCGEWQTDRRNGRGRLVYITGDVYDGKWVGDDKCGEGTLVTKSAGGETYTGEWHSGERNGHGTYAYADQSVYVGQWRRGQRHGRGKLTAAGGREEYVGSWSNGQRHGNGTHRNEKGDVYTGSYHADLRTGNGHLEFGDGSRYDGEWREGLQGGQGSYWSVAGEHYVGQWKAGQRSGHGTCEYVGGDVYEGEWRGGKRHGRGKLIYAPRDTGGDAPGWQAGFTPRDIQLTRPADTGRPIALTTQGFTGVHTSIDVEVEPTTYEGEWVEDLRSGQGKMSSGGEVYEGAWIENRRNGHGVCWYPDGECYVGQWIDGKRQGEGALAHK